MRRRYERARKKLAWKLKNPRIQDITFHTFRHWKATMLYHKTKDIVYVQRFLGHKSITNTLRYVQLAEAIFAYQDDEYICKVAKTPEDAVKLIEKGYTKQDEFDGIHLYRKRK